jgi:hypothetical protein
VTTRGDELVPDATVVMDRYLEFNATREEVWPWLVQLGKGRGGWYLPRSIELFIPRPKRATRVLLPEFQNLLPGMDTPDWGPGDPVFRVAEIEPDRALIYLSLRDKSVGHRWPPSDRRGPGVLALSWALLLDDAPAPDDATGPGTRVHIRLRLAPSGRRTRTLIDIGGGFIDWLTIVGLRRGLAERLESQLRVSSSTR